MSVIVCHSGRLPTGDAYDAWLAIGRPRKLPGRERELTVPGSMIGSAFDQSSDEWFELARCLAHNATAYMAHMPVCPPNVSDFGLMLAWSRIVQDLVGEPRRILVICDDPWMFRHLAALPGVTAAHPPSLVMTELRLRCRGIVSRIACAARLVTYLFRCRADRCRAVSGSSWILVYGHPASDDDNDAYFGDLMRRMPQLRRALHVDCTAGQAARLRSSERTVSLHAWGSIKAAFRAMLTRWRPSPGDMAGPYQWLVRRAATLEGATAQAAMIRWQSECQKSWLDEARPAAVAWPWENYAWERMLVIEARQRGRRTIGYQHSVVGRQMLNCSPASFPVGVDSLPDRIFCNGLATQEQLISWGIPVKRLSVAGALRFRQAAGPHYDPDAPVLLALPFDDNIALQMVEAARLARSSRLRFLVKEHPLFPKQFEEAEGLQKTPLSLLQHKALSAVVYSATTVGLEAILLGLPTLRYVPLGCLALDILPVGVTAPEVDAQTLGSALRSPLPPPCVERATIFAPVDHDLWRRGLAA